VRADRELVDPVIHQPVRLAVLGMLRAADEVEFKLLREELGVSESSLSQHLTVLSDAGLIRIRKREAGRRVRTWVAVTAAGRAALARYVAQIRVLAGDNQPSAQTP
jgi:DNA-binding MarR family transcriptional regulator